MTDLQLDVLAEETVRAAEAHGIPSREHDAAMDAFAEAEEEAGQQIGPALPGFKELSAAQERAAELTETGTDAEYAAAVAERHQTEAAFNLEQDRQVGGWEADGGWMHPRAQTELEPG